MSFIEWYTKHRVVHINGNIIAASLISAILTAGIISSSKGLVEGVGSIVILTAVLDGVFDVALFFGLHLWSSSQRAKKRFGPKIAAMDAGIIQLQRFFLVPLYYLTAAGTQSFLLMHGVERGASVLVAYVFALLVTRILHTIYGVRTGLFN